AQQRPPRLSKAHAWISERAGVEIADWLFCDNPGAMMDDLDLPYQPDLVGTHKKSLWARLRG
ncbi:MAG: hypothetical protein ACRD2D_01770, partial [Terriglobales bacterium]